MSFGRSEAAPATGWLLSLRLGALLGLVILGLVVIVDQLLGQSLAERDRELITARLQNYQRIADHGELSKLYGVLDEEQRGGLLDDWLISVDSGALYGSGRWSRQTLPAVPIDSWQEYQATDGSRWMLVRHSLGPELEVLIGLDAAARLAQRAEYRWAMAALVSPLWLLTIALMAHISRRTLSPIRDLIGTVESIRSSRDLAARVQVRAPESELGQLSVLVNTMLSTIGHLVTGMRDSFDHVAHDLRTPLARLRLNLEQLLVDSKAPPTPVQARALGESIEECNRIEAILNALLEIAEAEYGLKRPDYRRLDATRLLREVAELYEFVAEDAGIRLQLEAPDGIELDADEGRLRQALANLLDNAIKYTPAGGTVFLEAVNTGEQILLRVSDTGIGISDADRPHIYERLFRGDRSRSSKGLGLGLSLVRAVVEAHQGSITETSTPGQGSCFEIRLPLRPPAA